MGLDLQINEFGIMSENGRWLTLKAERMVIDKQAIQANPTILTPDQTIHGTVGLVRFSSPNVKVKLHKIVDGLAARAQGRRPGARAGVLTLNWGIRTCL